MNARSRPRALKAVLSRRLLAIAAVVILANTALVALFDASDHDALVLDLTRREVLRLEAAYLSAAPGARAIPSIEGDIYSRFPSAYAYALVDAAGRVVGGRNSGVIPAHLLQPGELAPDWLAWPRGADHSVVAASHVVVGADPPVRIVFYMAGDPAGLLGDEILDEFRGHVLLPLLPIAVLLIGGSLLVIGRALRPVAAAAAWARAIRPGQPLAALDTPHAPAEIRDLTDAVRRSVERLDAELGAERRRAAEAAHALRTPVSVLVARMDELPEGEPFDRLRSDVRALARLVTQYLSSSGADRLELRDDERAELDAVAQRVVAELAPVAVRHGCEIVLVPGEQPCVVHGSADAMALALGNLVENAIHHAGPGQIDVVVGPGPEITVSDAGPGLPPVPADVLFEPFRRGPGAARGGAGLGLAIVARVQRAHGGRVDAGPSPAGGASFRLVYRLPGAGH